MLPLQRPSGQASLNEIGSKRQKHAPLHINRFKQLPLDLQAKIFSYLSRGQFLSSVKVMAPGKVGPNIVRWLNGNPEESLAHCHGRIKNMYSFLKLYGKYITHLTSDDPYQVEQEGGFLTFRVRPESGFQGSVGSGLGIPHRLTSLDLNWESSSTIQKETLLLFQSIAFPVLEYLRMRIALPIDYAAPEVQVELPKLKKLALLVADGETAFCRFYQSFQAPELRKLFVQFDHYESDNLEQTYEDGFIQSMANSASSTSLKKLTIVGSIIDPSPIFTSPYLTQLTSLELVSCLEMEEMENIRLPMLKKLGLSGWLLNGENIFHNPFLTSLTKLLTNNVDRDQIHSIFRSTALTNLNTLHIRGKLADTNLLALLESNEGRGKLSSLTSMTIIEDSKVQQSSLTTDPFKPYLTTGVNNLNFHKLAELRVPNGGANFLVGLAQQANLRLLDLENCNLDDRHIEVLCQSPSVRALARLDLSSNRITHISIDLLKRHLPLLEGVFFAKNSRLCSAGAMALASWPILLNHGSLNLEECGIDDAGFKALIESPYTQYTAFLNMYRNPTTYDSVQALYRSPLYARLVGVVMSCYEVFIPTNDFSFNKEAIAGLVQTYGNQTTIQIEDLG